MTNHAKSKTGRLEICLSLNLRDNKFNNATANELECKLEVAAVIHDVDSPLMAPHCMILLNGLFTVM